MVVDYRSLTLYGRNAENEPVSRIKMADYRVLGSMGTLYLAIFETKPLYEKRQINSGATTIRAREYDQFVA